MINTQILPAILEGYKAYFPLHWKDEKFKWVAVQHFQRNWDIDAADFAEMFHRATAKTNNLLASGFAYPRAMIVNFAKADKTATKAMFSNLFDESRDLSARIKDFMAAAEEIRVKYDDGTWKSHYQNTNYISVYLWLRYPDKYFFYKYEEFRGAAQKLQCSYHPKRDGSTDSVLGGFKMLEELRQEILKDSGIRSMLKNALTDDCYPDPELRTLTFDVIFYISRYYRQEKQQDDANWFPSNYAPGILRDDWLKLLNDPAIFTKNSLAIMKRMLDYGGQATCTQLAAKYGANRNFYNNVSFSLARRIADATGCSLMQREDDSTRYWTVLYLGKPAERDEAGSYIWKLRPELKEALEQTDLSAVPLYAGDLPAI